MDRKLRKSSAPPIYPGNMFVGGPPRSSSSEAPIAKAGLNTRHVRNRMDTGSYASGIGSKAGEFFGSTFTDATTRSSENSKLHGDPSKTVYPRITSDSDKKPSTPPAPPSIFDGLIRASKNSPTSGSSVYNNRHLDNEMMELVRRLKERFQKERNREPADPKELLDYAFEKPSATRSPLSPKMSPLVAILNEEGITEPVAVSNLLSYFPRFYKNAYPRLAMKSQNHGWEKRYEHITLPNGENATELEKYLTDREKYNKRGFNEFLLRKPPKVPKELSEPYDRDTVSREMMDDFEKYKRDNEVATQETLQARKLYMERLKNSYMKWLNEMSSESYQSQYPSQLMGGEDDLVGRGFDQLSPEERLATLMDEVPFSLYIKGQTKRSKTAYDLFHGELQYMYYMYFRHQGVRSPDELLQLADTSDTARMAVRQALYAAYKDWQKQYGEYKRYSIQDFFTLSGMFDGKEPEIEQTIAPFKEDALRSAYDKWGGVGGDKGTFADFKETMNLPEGSDDDVMLNMYLRDKLREGYKNWQAEGNEGTIEDYKKVRAGRGLSQLADARVADKGGRFGEEDYITFPVGNKLGFFPKSLKDERRQDYLNALHAAGVTKIWDDSIPVLDPNTRNFRTDENGNIMTTKGWRVLGVGAYGDVGAFNPSDSTWDDIYSAMYNNAVDRQMEAGRSKPNEAMFVPPVDAYDIASQMRDMGWNPPSELRKLISPQERARAKRNAEERAQKEGTDVNDIHFQKPKVLRMNNMGNVEVVPQDWERRYASDASFTPLTAEQREGILEGFNRRGAAQGPAISPLNPNHPLNGRYEFLTNYFARNRWENNADVQGPLASMDNNHGWWNYAVPDSPAATKYLEGIKRLIDIANDSTQPEERRKMAKALFDEENAFIDDIVSKYMRPYSEGDGTPSYEADYDGFQTYMEHLARNPDYVDDLYRKWEYVEPEYEDLGSTAFTQLPDVSDANLQGIARHVQDVIDSKPDYLKDKATEWMHSVYPQVFVEEEQEAAPNDMFAVNRSFGGPRYIVNPALLSSGPGIVDTLLEGNQGDLYIDQDEKPVTEGAEPVTGDAPQTGQEAPALERRARYQDNRNEIDEQEAHNEILRNISSRVTNARALILNRNRSGDIIKRADYPDDELGDFRYERAIERQRKKGIYLLRELENQVKSDDEYNEEPGQMVEAKDKYGKPMTKPVLDSAGNPVIDRLTGKPKREPVMVYKPGTLERHFLKNVGGDLFGESPRAKEFQEEYRGTYVPDFDSTNPMLPLDVSYPKDTPDDRKALIYIDFLDNPYTFKNPDKITPRRDEKILDWLFDHYQVADMTPGEYDDFMNSVKDGFGEGKGYAKLLNGFQKRKDVLDREKELKLLDEVNRPDLSGALPRENPAGKGAGAEESAKPVYQAMDEVLGAIHLYFRNGKTLEDQQYEIPDVVHDAVRDASRKYGLSEKDREYITHQLPESFKYYGTKQQRVHSNFERDKENFLELMQAPLDRPPAKTEETPVEAGAGKTAAAAPEDVAPKKKRQLREPKIAYRGKDYSKKQDELEQQEKYRSAEERSRERVSKWTPEDQAMFAEKSRDWSPEEWLMFDKEENKRDVMGDEAYYGTMLLSNSFPNPLYTDTDSVNAAYQAVRAKKKAPASNTPAAATAADTPAAATAAAPDTKVSQAPEANVPASATPAAGAPNTPPGANVSEVKTKKVKTSEADATKTGNPAKKTQGRKVKTANGRTLNLRSIDERPDNQNKSNGDIGLTEEERNLSNALNNNDDSTTEKKASALDIPFEHIMGSRRMSNPGYVSSQGSEPIAKTKTLHTMSPYSDMVAIRGEIIMKSSREYTEDEEKDLAEHAKDEPPSEEEMDEMARHYASMEKSARTSVMDMIDAARRRR